MVVVGQRIGPGRKRRFPRSLGQGFKSNQGLAGKHRALARGDGYQRRIGCAIDVLESVERCQLRIVGVEQAAVVVGDADEPGPGGQRKHQKAGEPDDQPSAAQNGGGVAVQRHGRHRFSERCPGREGRPTGIPRIPASAAGAGAQSAIGKAAWTGFIAPVLPLRRLLGIDMVRQFVADALLVEHGYVENCGEVHIFPGPFRDQPVPQALDSVQRAEPP